VGRMEQVTLPNGLVVEAPSRGEAAFLFEEIFTGSTYRRHGIEVSDGATVFDVGANIGLFSAWVAQQRRGLRLVLFEPVPSTFAILEHNVRHLLGNADVTLRCAGLAATPGRLTLDVNPKWSLDAGVANRRLVADARRAAGLRTWTRALVQDTQRWGGVRPRTARALDRALTGALTGPPLLAVASVLTAVSGAIRRKDVRQLDCPMTTVSAAMRDHDIPAIDLLKIDVEGAEWEVLKGIQDEDWPRIRQIVMEVHDVDGRLTRVCRLLEDKGFVAAAEAGDWELLRLMGVHMVYARRPGERGP
jgi:31-O-methyltransferase